MALMAIVSCFVLASCGDDPKDDPKPKTENTAADWKDTGKEIVITSSESTPYGTVGLTIKYPYSGEMLTGYSIVYDCASETVAKLVYEELIKEEDSDDMVFTLKGSKITGTSKGRAFEGLTKDYAIIIAGVITAAPGGELVD